MCYSVGQSELAVVYISMYFLAILFHCITLKYLYESRFKSSYCLQLLNISPWGWMIMDIFTIGNAKPSNMSRNIQNTDVRQVKAMLLSICGQSVGFPRNKAPGDKCCWICGQGHTTVWPSRVS